MQLPEKTTERLLLYRMLLMEFKARGNDTIHSYELAELANNSSALVRRDIMATGYMGMPTKGYHVTDLIDKIRGVLNLDSEIRMALVGVGNLGSAILHFFSERHTRFSLIAAFDTDSNKVNHTIAGCKIYPVENVVKAIREKEITIAIIATPGAVAQDVADQLVEAGIKGIFNFTSIPLKVPEHVELNRIDITLQLEKLAFFSQ